MSDELNLVRDLAVILISAGAFTIISKALKQPLILGYILAGFLVGPHRRTDPPPAARPRPPSGGYAGIDPSQTEFNA